MDADEHIRIRLVCKADPLFKGRIAVVETRVVDTDVFISRLRKQTEQFLRDRKVDVFFVNITTGRTGHLAAVSRIDHDHLIIERMRIHKIKIQISVLDPALVFKHLIRLDVHVSVAVHALISQAHDVIRISNHRIAEHVIRIRAGD